MKLLLQHLRELIAIMMCCHGSAFGQIVFDDGQPHVLSQDVSQHVQVLNGSSLDIQSRIESGTPALVVDQASAELNGGTITVPPEQNAFEPIVTLERAGFVLSAGVIRHSGILANDSNVRIDGGQIDPGENQGIFAKGSSSIEVNGGTISPGIEVGGGIWLNDSATLGVSDGHVNGSGFAVRLFGNTSAEMTGGILDGLSQFDVGGGGGVLMSDSSRFRLLAGTVRGNAFEGAGTGFTLQQDATLDVFGGTIDAENFEFSRGRHLQVLQNGTVTLHGSGFNFPLFEPIQPLEGTITGVLHDGAAIDWAFTRDTTATIILVPEPTTLSMLTMGLIGIAIQRRRNGV